MLQKKINTVILTYLESAMFDIWVLEGSDHSGQKETYCIPLMKAGTRRNLHQKKNMLAVIQSFFRTHYINLFQLITSITYVYMYVLQMYVHTKQSTMYAMAKDHYIDIQAVTILFTMEIGS